ncbi:12966_t:CDS:1, partial [Racocetra persica]
FKANQQFQEASEFTYADFPTHWVYNKQHKEWKPRQKGNTIGR